MTVNIVFVILALIMLLHDLSHSYDLGILFTDFVKAFDTIPSKSNVQVTIVSKVMSKI